MGAIIHKEIADGLRTIRNYIARFKYDGGTMLNSGETTRKFYKFIKDNNIPTPVFSYLSGAATKLRTSGINTFATKLYSLFVPTAQARRNLLTYTEEFDNAAWSKVTMIRVGDVNAPDGSLTADSYSTNGGYSVIQQQITTISETIYTASVYLKHVSGVGSLAVRFTDLVSLNFTQVTVNLVSGTLGAISYNGTGKNGSATITPAGNSWYRISISGAITQTLAGLQVTNATFGDEAFYLWGAQLEVGSSPASYQRVIDANSWTGVIPDATQSTANSQPYISGNIAPNEKPCLKNNNGDSRYMTHPTISFAANEAWSVTTVVNWNGFDSVNSSIFGDNLSLNSRISIIDSANGTYRFSINNASGVGALGVQGKTLQLLGKYKVLTFIANGQGKLSIYVNGTLSDELASVTDFIFNSLMAARQNTRIFNGSIHAHIIRSQTLTPTQAAAEANFLRSLYPEIPSVTIGSQVWATSNCEMVATPMGNLIANVTDNTAWSNSTATYNSVYAATSGTDEQKTYAAVKAAAMWCYYSNDVALGAIYGKLYNWYAVKLLQMDIDYYNAANPTTPWGWRVPTDTDFDTLATTLGGASVAGGKIKKDGLVYWLTPNTGANNSSGFSAIGVGVRQGDTGSFAGINLRAGFHLINGVTINPTTLFRHDQQSIYSLSNYCTLNNGLGLSLRLIKS